MYQYLTFDRPIPSCAIHSLKFDKSTQKWSYIYALKTPFELTNENTKELIIYEYISDLYLKEADSVHPESINIRIKTLDEYVKLLNEQIKADLEYRKSWLEKNPNAKPSTVELENKDYSNIELQSLNVHFVANMVEKGDKTTIFAAI